MSQGETAKRRLCRIVLVLTVLFLVAFLVLFLNNSSRLDPLSGGLLLLCCLCAVAHVSLTANAVPDGKRRYRALALGIIGAICLAASFPLRQYLFSGWPRSILADVAVLVGIACLGISEGMIQTNRKDAN